MFLDYFWKQEKEGAQHNSLVFHKTIKILGRNTFILAFRKKSFIECNLASTTKWVCQRLPYYFVNLICHEIGNNLTQQSFASKVNEQSIPNSNSYRKVHKSVSLLYRILSLAIFTGFWCFQGLYLIVTIILICQEHICFRVFQHTG